MKKILLAGFLFAAFQAVAQDNTLTNRDFWQTRPEVATVKTELAKGFNFKNVHGASDPIFLAISGDAPAATIKYLIDQPDVDLTHTTVEGRIYLHIAAHKGNAEITDYLIAKGSDMYMLDANGHTALTYTAFNGQLTTAVVDAFLKHGLDIQKKYKEKDGANLLMLAVPYDKDLSITNYLVSKGIALNSTDNNGNTAFDHAAKIGNIAIMKALLQKGVKYNANALLLASQGTYRSANSIEVYKYLVDDLKINPLITNKAGQNVLHGITRKQNQAEVVSYFLAKGVDVNKVDQDGNTPFINAAGGRSPEVVEMMLPKVKKINAVNGKGESALLAAVKSSTGEVVALLLKNGADVSVIDKEGHSLAYYLVESYNPQGGGRGGRGGGFGGGRGGAPQNAGVAGSTTAARPQPQDDFGNKLKALQSKGLNLTAPQKDGNTLYHLAVAKNDVEILKKIAGLQIDVNAKNKEGITAMHKAAMVSKDDTILKYLLSIGAKKDAVTALNESVYDLAKENETLTKSSSSLDFLK